MGVDLPDYYRELLALSQVFFHVTQVAVADQAVLAGDQFHEGAEVGQTHHLAGEYIADLQFPGQGVYLGTGQFQHGGVHATDGH